jgi:hypothetical protein
MQMATTTASEQTQNNTWVLFRNANTILAHTEKDFLPEAKSSFIRAISSIMIINKAIIKTIFFSSFIFIIRNCSLYYIILKTTIFV